MTVAGDVITWTDGSVSKVQQEGGDKLFILFRGKKFYATLEGAKLTWSDGDVWTRVKPATVPEPNSRPKVGPRPSSQQKSRPPSGSQAAGGKAAITYTADALACLGLDAKPSAEELRKAYKKAALQWHPDRRQNHDCAETAKRKFQEVRAAFELLQVQVK